MKTLTVSALLVLLVVATSATASAFLATGTTTLLGTPTAGLPLDVDVSVASDIPVVPYEYAIENECYFSGKASGRPDSYQRDVIVGWAYSSPAPYGDVPHAIMTANLLPVPAGSLCKVSIVRDNATVKGSTTIYNVE